MRQVRRRDRDGIGRLPGERRLASKNGVRVESIGSRRRDARPSQPAQNSAALTIASVVRTTCLGEIETPR